MTNIDIPMLKNVYCHAHELSHIKLAPATSYRKEDQYVPPVLAKWLRPHQREGVTFMYDCVMGLKEFAGNGCILADDMGLGMSI